VGYDPEQHQRETRAVFVIIDEAHRGTRLDKGKAADANSIMQRFLLGTDEMPPVPLVVGISATLERFTELLHAAAKAKKSRTHQAVDVDPADVMLPAFSKRRSSCTIRRKH
jgi:type III restriction enzyme